MISVFVDLNDHDNFLSTSLPNNHVDLNDQVKFLSTYSEFQGFRS